jgi:hypothetical protein
MLPTEFVIAEELNIDTEENHPTQHHNLVLNIEEEG